MVNVLIADDNLEFDKKLINNILHNKDIRVCKLCTNGLEVLNILNTEEIDVVILDILMPICNGIEVLNKLSELQKQKLKESIIILSGDSSFFPQLMENPLIYDYIIKTTQTNEITARIDKLIESKNFVFRKKEIIKELEKIGYDTNYKGTNYLIDAILQMFINGEKMIGSLQRDVYPIIARMYHTTPHNIKCNINNATEAMYYNCNSEFLRNYFHYFDDTKPTTKTVIYTVLNKIS